MALKSISYILFVAFALNSCQTAGEKNNDNFKIENTGVEPFSIQEAPKDTQLNKETMSEPEWFKHEIDELKQIKLELKCWKEELDVDGQKWSISRFPKMTCEASAYWNIVSHGEEVIPVLIGKLNDTTETKLYHDCKKGTLNVNEVCYLMLLEIIDVPLAAITQSQYCIFDSCTTYSNFTYANRNPENFKNQLLQYYDTHTYSFEKFEETKIDSCLRAKGIEGRYKINY